MLTYTGKWHLSKFYDNAYDYDAAVETVQACGFDFVDALYIENMESNEDDFDNYNDGTFSHNMEFVTYEAINFINDNDGVSESLCLQFLCQYSFLDLIMSMLSFCHLDNTFLLIFQSNSPA